jgi:hyperosmotically inducible protein
MSIPICRALRAAGLALVAAALLAPVAGAEAETEAKTERSDALITERVKAAIEQASFAEAHEIDVRTEDGVVTLRGQVTSPTEHEQAVRLARGVKGVSDVEDELSVAPQDPERLPALSEGLEGAPGGLP